MGSTALVLFSEKPTWTEVRMSPYQRLKLYLNILLSRQLKYFSVLSLIILLFTCIVFLGKESTKSFFNLVAKHEVLYLKINVTLRISSKSTAVI
jgi:hypothetical protein